jgi:hypothetical protein
VPLESAALQKKNATHKQTLHNKHNTRKHRKRVRDGIFITRSACSGARTTDAAVDAGTMSAALQLRVSAGELQPGSAMGQVYAERT